MVAFHLRLNAKMQLINELLFELSYLIHVYRRTDSGPILKIFQSIFQIFMLNVEPLH